jgi:AraC-like DNA-binding protein
LGYNLASLIDSAGLNRFDLEDPDIRVPCEAFGALFGRVMQERRLKNLGVRMAAHTAVGAFPLLDYLVVTSKSVGEGVKQLAHYFRLVGTPTHLDVRDDEDPIRVVVWAGNNAALAVEFTVSLTVLNLRQETDQQLSPEWVAFAHKPDDVSEIERLLGCPVRAESPWSGLALSATAWQLPFRRRDPVLRALLERQANEIIAHLPAQDGVALDVRRALAKRIAGGDTRINSVARDLATTARTLQRRLADAGFSYQDLVELTRREAAEKYLADCSLTIAEVAYLLGYSEPSALHRAFKRWNHTTPQLFRQRLLRGARKVSQ